MVGYRFSRTFPERPRWHMRMCLFWWHSEWWVLLWRAGHLLPLSGRSWGIVFSLACWSRQPRGPPRCRCCFERLALGIYKFQRVVPVAFMLEMLPCSISLFQPGGLAPTPLFGIRKLRWKTVNSSMPVLPLRGTQLNSRQQLWPGACQRWPSLHMCPS